MNNVALYTKQGCSPRSARAGFLKKAHELFQEGLSVYSAAETLRKDAYCVHVMPTNPPELVLSIEGTDVCFRWAN